MSDDMNTETNQANPNGTAFTEMRVPAYLVARARRRSDPSESLVSALRAVNDENSFPVFCCNFVDAFRKIEKEEFDRDVNGGQSFDSNEKGQSSIWYDAKQIFTDGACSLLEYFGVWEKKQDELQIRLAERCAKFLLERFAFQKVMHVFRGEFGPDEMTLPHLEEARRRKLPALSRILADFAEISASPQPRGPYQTRSVGGIQL